MINLVFAVYDKTGHRLLGPVDTGTLWAGFAVPDCTDPSATPSFCMISRGPLAVEPIHYPRPIYYNCVAISQTGDPTAAYFRYAFSAGEFFPDYPKYGVGKILHSDFARLRPNGELRHQRYGLEKSKMLKAIECPLGHSSWTPPWSRSNLIGDGLLPADIDGSKLPTGTAPVHWLERQDDDIPYGATVDAINIWDMTVVWKQTPVAFHRISRFIRNRPV